MMKTFLKTKFVFAGLFLFLMAFTFSNIALADDGKINAGLLSDIWFSKLELKNDDKVSIYGSFQNTSGKTITGEAVFYINDKEIDKEKFSVEDGKVTKIETSWTTETGDFDIKIIVDNLKIDGSDISPNSLIKKESLIKIKITRKIDVEYVKEIGTNVYKDTVKVINKVVNDTSNSLETIKVRETSQVGGDSGGGSVLGSVSDGADGSNPGSVKGIQYSKDEVEGVNNGGSGLKNDNKGEVVTDIKNRPFDALRNFSISILQFILKHWAIFLGCIIFLFILLKFRKRR
jgi:hypothetical protein